MSTDSLIISLPHRQSAAQRSLYASLTALAWFGWIFLWLPLITALAWAMGLDLAYARVVLDDAAHGASDLLFLLRAGLICATVFLGWALYNRWRYGRQERRRGVTTVSHETIAHYFGADSIVSQRLRNQRRSVLHVDASGRPVRAVIDPPLRHSIAAPAAADDGEHGYDLRPATSEHPEALTPVK
ncbi:poly-beta-1,6-N-acetyl-D-glucosamine biosynthesis protein PgaD [Tahibacter aquaticus]|uniref:Poly-beta-1,6-N-acetyl-D-glucosamine biosynthesis protein PgaD n=1 Tax=Tahibacter aquaticus TaxID=520092 RepID=A0A4R6Z075_9GAMM|nr:poly-beta-1,6-N-acetyl-D-glucosamine biosynthesis protein PgaD [Tahibacter aquaticus]TDR44911.1 poly-beta-1,6-N-acetyl-D-glucosamine biosynthesis protein PgaD [Tahibacter aquaticus]